MQGICQWERIEHTYLILNEEARDQIFLQTKKAALFTDIQHNTAKLCSSEQPCFKTPSFLHLFQHRVW